MKISGIVAIKTVNKGNNNGKVVYTGKCVYRIYNNQIEIPFYYPVNSKQEAFLDNYLMIPGKSGLACGTLQSNNGEFFFYMDSMEFGSLKLEVSNNYQQNNYQQNRGSYNQQNESPAPVYQAPQQQTEVKSGLNNFFAQNNNNNNNANDDVKANTPSSNFWANIGKSGN